MKKILNQIRAERRHVKLAFRDVAQDAEFLDWLRSMPRTYRKAYIRRHTIASWRRRPLVEAIASKITEAIA